MKGYWNILMRMKSWMIRETVAMFISVIGASTYELLQALCSTDLPNTKTFKELQKLLKLILNLFWGRTG